MLSAALISSWRSVRDSAHMFEPKLSAVRARCDCLILDCSIAFWSALLEVASTDPGVLR
jgi:hypothetical protein